MSMTMTTLLRISMSLLCLANRPPRYVVSAADEVAVVEEFVVAGYLPDYRAYINVNSTTLHLTDMMIFSLTPDSILRRYSNDTVLLSPNQSGRCCLSSEHFDLTRKARAYKQEHQPTEQIRILVTVGGGGRSNGFHELVTGSGKLQRQFIQALVDLCRDEVLDGIDFDYEGIQSLDEWNAYLTFLSMASTYLHRENLIATVALHPGQLLPIEVCQSLDRVHVMTYDMMPTHQPSNADSIPNNHHASLHSTKEAIEKFINYGCHPSKLIIGIPAYGRHEKNMGLVRTYFEVMDDVLKEYSNNAGGAMNTIQSIQSWGGYRFDSPDDVRDKVNCAMQFGLGGIFLWELGQDKQLAGIAEGGILLEEAVAAVIHGLGLDIVGNDVTRDEL